MLSFFQRAEANMLMRCLAQSKVCMKGLLLREIKAKNKQEKGLFFCLICLKALKSSVVVESSKCLFPDFFYSQSLFEFKRSAALDVEACQRPKSWPQFRKINKK